MGILVNGKAYDWGSITIFALGFVLTSATEIKYGVKQKKTNNPGAGTEPDSRGYGDKEYSCDVTIGMNDIRKIRAALPAGQTLLDVPPFPITVSYLVGTKITTDKIYTCEFTDDEIEAKSGDTHLAQKCTLICSGLKLGS